MRELVEGLIYQGGHPIASRGWRVLDRVGGSVGPARGEGVHNSLGCAGELHQEAGCLREVIGG